METQKIMNLLNGSDNENSKKKNQQQKSNKKMVYH